MNKKTIAKFIMSFSNRTGIFQINFNNRLKKNYYAILQQQTAEEVDHYLKTLNDEEIQELNAYIFGNVIPERQKNGIPITEFYLLHFDDYVPEIFKCKTKRMNILFSGLFYVIVTAIVIIAIFLLSD